MITEAMIARAFIEYRITIGKGPEKFPEEYSSVKTPEGVTWAHFKAAYLMASGISLERNGFSPENWQGDIITGAVAGEDLLG